MAEPLIAGIPALELTPGMSVVFEAVDATTGAAVTGVTVTAVAIYGLDLRGASGNLAVGPFMLVPGPGA